jgi:hypothetical protein
VIGAILGSLAPIPSICRDHRARRADALCTGTKKSTARVFDASAFEAAISGKKTAYAIMQIMHVKHRERPPSQSASTAKVHLPNCQGSTV